MNPRIKVYERFDEDVREATVRALFPTGSVEESFAEILQAHVRLHKELDRIEKGETRPCS